LTARTVTAATECFPFPYVKGVLGTVVILLETVEVNIMILLRNIWLTFLQKVHKNRDDLKELCQSTMEIVAILEDQLSSHGNTAALKLRGLCEELERSKSIQVEPILPSLIAHIQHL
jgi:hypothetical protein